MWDHDEPQSRGATTLRTSLAVNKLSTNLYRTGRPSVRTTWHMHLYTGVDRGEPAGIRTPDTRIKSWPRDLPASSVDSRLSPYSRAERPGTSYELGTSTALYQEVRGHRVDISAASAFLSIPFPLLTLFRYARRGSSLWLLAAPVCELWAVGFLDKVDVINRRDPKRELGESVVIGHGEVA